MWRWRKLSPEVLSARLAISILYLPRGYVDILDNERTARIIVIMTAYYSIPMINEKHLWGRRTRKTLHRRQPVIQSYRGRMKPHNIWDGLTPSYCSEGTSPIEHMRHTGQSILIDLSRLLRHESTPFPFVLTAYTKFLELLLLLL